MIEITNKTLGVNFSYTGENCTATGNYDVENDTLKHVGVNGHYTKGADVYGFTADRDENGNVNIAGVPASVLADVAEEVAALMAEVEAEAEPEIEK